MTRFKSKNTIEFINTTEYELEPPVPAINMLPDWYKNQPSYIDNNKSVNVNHNSTAATIKKCIPVFDSLTAGYLITTPVELYLNNTSGKLEAGWRDLDFIGSHPNKQLKHHPKNVEDGIPKIINPWGIKTPAGYSCLFISPMHRDNKITIFPGVVDTDTYNVPVNFAFTVEGTINTILPVGTPIVQVIPFKRESWSHTTNKTDLGDLKEQLFKKNARFFNGYKDLFWYKKDFK